MKSGTNRGSARTGSLVVVGLLGCAAIFVGGLFVLGKPKPRMKIDPYTGKPIDPAQAGSREAREAQQPRILSLEGPAADAAEIGRLNREIAELREGPADPVRNREIGRRLVARGLVRARTGDRAGAGSDLDEATQLGADATALRRALAP